MKRVSCASLGSGCTAGTAGAKVTEYVYDAEGALAATYGEATSGMGSRFVTLDGLGSTRLVTDWYGNVVERVDYLPFGEEIPAGVGGRTAGQGYSGGPSVTVRFTGKERERTGSGQGMGLDYFGARYYSPAGGRFASPDAPFADQHVEDPQSWNLYTYVRNNPLGYVDPTGRECVNGVSSGYEDQSQNGNACFTVTSTADRAIKNPFFFAVAKGASQAAPVVNAIGHGLVLGAELTTGIPIGLIADLGTTDPAAGGAQSAEASTAAILLRNPQDIRFTQNSISAEFRNGQNIGSTIDALRTGAASPAEIAPIRTFERNGLTFTLDNRRLFAASEAGTQIATRPATPGEILRSAFKFTSTTEGRYIAIRGAVKALTRGRF